MPAAIDKTVESMKRAYKLAAALALLMSVVSERAAMLANTGAAVDADGSDKNWTLASVVPGDKLGDDPSVPYGLSLPNAYVVNDDGNFPFNGYWLRNSLASRWITYAAPMYTGGDIGRTFDYRLAFTATADGVVNFRWASDNSSEVTLDGTKIANNGQPNPNNYTTFNSWSYGTFNVTKGTGYTLDVDVLNIGQDSGNPTGMRFEVVPEASTMFAGAGALGLVLLGLGVHSKRSAVLRMGK
jgi:hypothetical protein